MGAMITVGFVTACQLWFARRKQIMSWTEIAASALVGLVLGLILDVVLGWGLKLWAYARHPYWEWSYWTVLPAMWTMFGVSVTFFWKVLRPRWLTILLHLVVYELYGIVRQSWQYGAPWWVVALGWVPLVLTIVVLTERVAKLLTKEAKVAEFS